jgi:acyl-CoA synthetase (AMP-forming)/AMP-acid ligase II
MREYWNKPEATEEAFRGGWYHTGDAGYLDANGYLFLVDRVKDMIVTGGENVYSVEVENAIVSHPDVVQCAVIGIPIRPVGRGGTRDRRRARKARP